MLKTSVGASTAQMQVVVAEEELWGIVPDKVSFEEMRLTGQSLNIDISTSTSSEIRSDRNISDLISNGVSAQGSLEFEISKSPLFEKLLSGALFSCWSTASIASINGDLQMVSSGKQLVYVAPSEGKSLADKFKGITKGQWVRISGFKKTTNNGLFLVDAVDSNSIKLNTKSLEDETAEGSNVKVQGSYIKNGTNAHSYTIERRHLGLEKYFNFTGMCINQASLKFSGAGETMSGSFAFMGKDGLLQDTSITKNNIIPASTSPVFNNTDNLAELRINKSTDDVGYLQSLELSIDNGLRAQNALGHTGLIGISEGACKVTGKVSSYFHSSDIYNKMRESESLSIDWRLTGNGGETYIITLPKVKLKGEINATGMDSDVMLELDFTALFDPETNCAIQIDKFEKY